MGEGIDLAFYFVYLGHKYGLPKVQAFIRMALELVASLA